MYQYKLVHKILQENAQQGFITEKDFLEISSENKEEFELLIKKEIKKLTDIYNKRYKKDFGKLQSSSISFLYHLPYSVDILLSLYKKTFTSHYIIQTNIDYNIQKKQSIFSNFYIFFKVNNNGKNFEKIAEGDEKEEYTTKGKYGELLSIKNPIKNLRNIKNLILLIKRS